MFRKKSTHKKDLILKSRFFMLHPECNPGKIASLEALHAEYTAYVRICVQMMLEARRLNLPRSKKQGFFPRSENLTSQIEKNARDHAIQIMSTWAKSIYVRKLKTLIWLSFKDGEFTEDFRKQLYTVGKYLVHEPNKNVTQEAIDLYWSWLSDPELVGNSPSVSNRTPIRLSEMTGKLQDPKEALYSDFWLNLSTLVPYKTVDLPLVGNPYVKRSSDVGKGIHARKDRKGRWRFEAVDTKEWKVREAEPNLPRIGVDVGLNVVAATSLGHTFGADLKPKFNRLYNKVRAIRSNRQRQDLKENSPRLDRLELKLSGLTKTATGRVSNELIRIYPESVFVLEDLDLRGCKGQKRFCYRALAHALESKALTEVVNPAYSSQTCPSCGHVSRSNRSGTVFVCRQCGRRSHSDVVGGINLLGRSENKQVGLEDDPSEVRRMLVRLYWARRNPNQDCPQDFLNKYAPLPYGRRLTTRGLSRKRSAGIASNLNRE
jgi:Putative transposase DNA-binding domain